MTFFSKIAERVPRARRRWVGLACVLVVALLGWPAVSWFLQGHAKAPDDSIPVTAEKTVAHDVPLYVESIGTVQAYNTVTVRARVDGELMNIAFHEGQNVKKGDVLAQIDPRPFQAALENAQGALAKDQAAAEHAKRDLERFQELSTKDFASRQQVESQNATFRSLSAAVKSDQAQIDNARVQLGYTTIISPIDGRTGIRKMDVGNIIHTTDADGLVVVVQLQPISAIFTLPQNQIAQVVQGQAQGQLQVTALDTNGTVELDHGVLELMDNQIDPTTGTVRLKASFPNDHFGLWPGEFIKARLQIGTTHNGITVPAQVAQRGPAGMFAFVVKADNTVEMRDIEVGAEHDGRLLVTKGLNNGEQVVVDGQLRLKPGSKVRIAQSDTQTQASTQAASDASPDTAKQ